MEVVDLEVQEEPVVQVVQVKVTDKQELMVLLVVLEQLVLEVQQELTPVIMLGKVELVELEDKAELVVPEETVATGDKLEAVVQLEPVETQAQQVDQVLTVTLLMDLEVQVDQVVHQGQVDLVEELRLIT